MTDNLDRISREKVDHDYDPHAVAEGFTENVSTSFDSGDVINATIMNELTQRTKDLWTAIMNTPHAPGDWPADDVQGQEVVPEDYDKLILRIRELADVDQPAVANSNTQYLNCINRTNTAGDLPNTTAGYAIRTTVQGPGSVPPGDPGAFDIEHDGENNTGYPG